MKTLIVEDEFTSRALLQEILGGYGLAHVAVNGREATDAARSALDKGEPYHLICMDIMMPEMDGLESLRKIRALEEEHGIFSSDGAVIVMTTVLDDVKNVMTAYQGLCDAYVTKPIKSAELLDTLRKSRLVKSFSL